MLPPDWLGAAAGTLTTVAFLPQVLKTWRSRSAHDVSALTFLLFSFGVALWLVYGWWLALWPLIIANGITLGLAATILWFKLRYGGAPAGGKLPSASERSIASASRS
jgi:MtN3 and saliva related transmembrane protein